MTRRGFALAELMVALVIAGIIGIALTRLVINQARFTSTQDGMMRARSAARAALNTLAAEMRMVTDSGLIAANRDSVVVRVPYAYGIVCGYSGSNAIVGLMPADSAAFASAVMDGYAWRDTVGDWNYVTTSTTASTNYLVCNSATPAITLVAVPGSWSAAAVTVPKTGAFTPPFGSLIYLYQVVTYRFAASTELPGRVALWRRAHAGATPEELVAPFDTSACFQFLIGSALTVQTGTPPVLDSVAGLHIKLVAASENTPQGRSSPLTFTLTANLLFRNHAL